MTSNLRYIATEPGNLNHKGLTLGDVKSSPPHLIQHLGTQLHGSDSDLSLDTTSLRSNGSKLDLSPGRSSRTGGSSPTPTPATPSPNDPYFRPPLTPIPARSLPSADWDILEGLRDGQRCEEPPARFDGIMLKRRKWPMKGWHKRYFILEKGILIYAKNQNDMNRGKAHGSVDVGLSFISTKTAGRRIDIDADECLYHLKVKPRELFNEWVKQLRHHRLYRQHEIAFGSREIPKHIPLDESGNPISAAAQRTQSDLVRSLSQPVTVTQRISCPIQTSAALPSAVSMPSSVGPQGKVASWLADATVVDQLNKDLASVQQNIFQLGTFLEQLEGFTSSASDPNVELPELCTANLKKDRKRPFLLRRKKTNKASSQVDLTASKSSTLDASIIPISLSRDTDVAHTAPLHAALLSQPRSIREMAHLSSSNPNLSTGDEKFRPHSLPEPSQLFAPPGVTSEQRVSEPQIREEFLSLAKEIHSSLRTVMRSMHNERDRLRLALEVDSLLLNNNNNTTSTSPALGGSGSPTTSLVNNLKNSLTKMLRQNSELRERLQRIHAESELSQASSPEQLQKGLHQSRSYESSSVLSASEYFDAAEYLGQSDTSTEASLSEEDDNESFTSENSEPGVIEYTLLPSGSDEDLPQPAQSATGRRSKLPVPQPNGDLNLWNLLCKNIGKDLSKVCMPVTLNEPLSTLQRLCEELEYSELLDKASEIDDPYERMVYVAAFAVSGYGSLYHRASRKPFNPLLGETFECIREDKGFRFIAEQVSHHPPISICHAESENYVMWQDMRIKTTFWGKSMEIQPIGSVNLLIPKYKSLYTWNKVTTCIHNVFSGQRYVDQYGELLISNGNISCKLTFVKQSYWSNKRYEVHGTITNEFGKVVHRLSGRWNEGLYCGVAPSIRCIWRPGALPEDANLYYGFTQFAVELNELDHEIAEWLPPTDSRFRPDQRLLEEGDIAGAEAAKLHLELVQRERKKKREEEGVGYEPLWFRKKVTDKKETWEFGGEYWIARAQPGFSNMTFPIKLW